jgi:hypothetical protein
MQIAWIWGFTLQVGSSLDMVVVTLKIFCILMLIFLTSLKAMDEEGATPVAVVDMF